MELIKNGSVVILKIFGDLFLALKFESR
jgi:hypothetical protein